MTIRAKQQRKQRSAIGRMARNPLSNWHIILNRGYIAWVVFKVVLTEVCAQEENIILNGTNQRAWS